MNELASKRWVESNGGLLLSAGVAVALVTFAAAQVETLTRQSSVFHFGEAAICFWALMQVPGLWKSSVTVLGVWIAVLILCVLLFKHFLWAVSPLALRSITALSGMSLSLPSTFLWTALGAFVGVVLGTLVFRRD